MNKVFRYQSHRNTVDVSPGKYLGRAVAAALRESRNQHLYLDVNFALVEGAWADAEVRWYGYLSEKARSRTLEAARNCGWRGSPEALVDAIGSRSDVATIFPDSVLLVVENDSNGPRVSWVNHATGGVSQAALAQRLRDRLANPEAFR